MGDGSREKKCGVCRGWFALAIWAVVTALYCDAYGRSSSPTPLLVGRHPPLYASPNAPLMDTPTGSHSPFIAQKPRRNSALLKLRLLPTPWPPPPPIPPPPPPPLPRRSPRRTWFST